ncbi:uncharacterized protein LOC120348460 [Styela clava]
MNIFSAVIIFSTLNIGEPLLCLNCTFDPELPNKGCGGNDITDGHYIIDCIPPFNSCYAAVHTLMRIPDDDVNVVAVAYLKYERGCRIGKKSGCEKNETTRTSYCVESCDIDICNDPHSLPMGYSYTTPVNQLKETTTPSGAHTLKFHLFNFVIISLFLSQHFLNCNI